MRRFLLIGARAFWRAFWRGVGYAAAILAFLMVWKAVR